MKRFAGAAGWLAAVALCPATTRANDALALRESVVKIYSTVQRSDYAFPWRSGQTMAGTGSGFLVSGRRLLTNAHVVSDARFLQVQKMDDPRLFTARVEFIAHDCDIASLTVDDPAFYAGLRPVRFAEQIPAVNDEVLVLGYPMGGTRLSVTRGVVSRIDYAPYSHSGIDQHLVLQVDAAINPGNSGGPVMFRSRVIGIAFQGLQGGQSLGYAIPLPVVNRFQEDVRDGRYDGFPELGAACVTTRNPALRASLGLPEPLRGMVVHHVHPYGSAQGRLRPRDVILKVDGVPVAEDGTVQIEGFNTPFEEIVERKQAGQPVEFVVWRDRRLQSVAVELRKPSDLFLYRNQYDKLPAYLVHGGLVFVPLSRELLSGLERHQGDPTVQRLFYYAAYATVDRLHEGRQEFVVLSRRLPSPINAYADPFVNGIVEDVNGTRIAGLASLKSALEKDRDGYHEIRFAGMRETLVLDAKAVRSQDPLILAAYGVSAPYRAEVRP